MSSMLPEYCISCRKEIAIGTAFCPHCGAQQGIDPNAVRQPPQQVPPPYAPGQPLAAPPPSLNVHRYSSPPGGQINIPGVGMRYAENAGFWMRFIAHLIDGLILLVPVAAIYMAIFMIFGGSFDMEPEEMDELFEKISIPVQMAILGVAWLYFSLFESSDMQGTPGKRAIGLRVTDMDGNKISFGRATGRHFGKIVSGLICNIGYIMAGFTENKQALHDMIASTLVVRVI